MPGPGSRLICSEHQPGEHGPGVAPMVSSIDAGPWGEGWA